MKSSMNANSKSLGQVVAASAETLSESEADPEVNVTVSCYDINNASLYLASVLILHPDWHNSIYSGVTNSSGVFEAINITITTAMVDVCVSWGNASDPGEPGYYMYFKSVDATSNIEFVANASELRDQGALAEVDLTIQAQESQHLAPKPRHNATKKTQPTRPLNPHFRMRNAIIFAHLPALAGV